MAIVKEHRCDARVRGGEREERPADPRARQEEQPLGGEGQMCHHVNTPSPSPKKSKQNNNRTTLDPTTTRLITSNTTRKKTTESKPKDYEKKIRYLLHFSLNFLHRTYTPAYGAIKRSIVFGSHPYFLSECLLLILLNS